MKRFLMLFVISALCGAEAWAQCEDIERDGKEAFAKGDYEAAKRLFSEGLDELLRDFCNDYRFADWVKRCDDSIRAVQQRNLSTDITGILSLRGNTIYADAEKISNRQLSALLAKAPALNKAVKSGRSKRSKGRALFIVGVALPVYVSAMVLKTY